MPPNETVQKLKTLIKVYDKASVEKEYSSKAEWVIATMQQIIQVLDQNLTKKEFTDAFKALTEHIKKAREVLTEMNKAEFSQLEKSLVSSIEQLRNDTQGSASETLASIKTSVDELLSSVRFSHEAMLSEAQAKLDAVKNGEDGNDGNDADEEVIVEKVLAKIPKPSEANLQPIEEKIEALDKRVSNIRTAPLIGPSRGVYLYINGVKKGLVNSLDIVGSGVATSVVNGLLTITITGGAGNGVNIETPSGTVNGTNLSFTVSNEPKYIIVDGVSKFVTTHYTYGGGTITLLADNAPVQFIRSVY